MPEGGSPNELSATEITRAVLAVSVGFTILTVTGMLSSIVAARLGSRHETLSAFLGSLACSLFAYVAGYLCVGISGRAARGATRALAACIGATALLFFGFREWRDAFSAVPILAVLGSAALAGAAVRLRQARGVPPTHRDQP